MKTKQLTLSAMCLTLSLILPQAFHMFANAGAIFLPMHFPIIICGFICGPFYGFIVGLLAPILSHLIFAMPTSALLAQMIVELAVYGLTIGLLNKCFKLKSQILNNYFILVLAMLIGRISYGLFNMLIFTNSYNIEIWLTAAFITSLPGIILQLIIVPVLVEMIKTYLN